MGVSGKVKARGLTGKFKHGRAVLKDQGLSISLNF